MRSVDRDLHLPDGQPRAAAVVLHPHPAMGGDRHHPLIVAVAEGLAGRGIAALRIDLSDPDPAKSSTALHAVAEELTDALGVRTLFLVGYSWGSVVTTMASPNGLAARVLVAPPVALPITRPAESAPTLALVPEHDQYGGPARVNEVMATWPATTIEVVEGADHFLAGAVGAIAARTIGWLAERS
jgi:alpha/beta superfamily hydrolase